MSKKLVTNERLIYTVLGIKEFIKYDLHKICMFILFILMDLRRICSYLQNPSRIFIRSKNALIITQLSVEIINVTTSNLPDQSNKAAFVA